jgi:hypothetical protein
MAEKEQQRPGDSIKGVNLFHDTPSHPCTPNYLPKALLGRLELGKLQGSLKKYMT